MQQYVDLVRHILEEGEDSGDRTKTGKRSIFGHHLRFDLGRGFPLLTLKQTPMRLVAEELFWFLSGSTNVRDLQAKKVHIWDAWETEWEGDFPDGYLGPIYGHQWRSWMDGSVDQINDLLYSLKRDPSSRRHLVTAWNPADVEYMRLIKAKAPPPCHLLFQCYISPQRRLDLQVYQRSADVFVGLPFNIASYALLLEMLAQVVGCVPRYLHFALGDAHLYHNHLDAAKELLARADDPANAEHLVRAGLPRLTLDPCVNDLFAFRWEHVRLERYNPLSAIKVEVAV